MDFEDIFSYNPNVDSYNGDIEPLVVDDDYKYSLNKDYKERFLSNKDG